VIGPRETVDYNRKTSGRGATFRPNSSARIQSRQFDVASPVSILIAIVVALVGLAVGYAMGRARSREGAATPAALRAVPAPVAETSPPPPATVVDVTRDAPPAAVRPTDDPLLADNRAIAERARIIRSYETESALLRRAVAGRDATIAHLAEFADERRRLFDEIAAARAETARYRQVIVDLENSAPPQFFGAGAPDDLKLIVGIGPVLERMLQMMGIATYRQIARWSDRDIDEFDAKLPEFPGRIRRDAWVTQARALHQSKYGEALPLRGRG